VELDEVFGDGECDRGAGELACVHVGVDPDRGADPVGLAADREEPQLATFVAGAERGLAYDLGVRRSPAIELLGEGGIANVGRAEVSAHARDYHQNVQLCQDGRAPAVATTRYSFRQW